MDTITLDCRGSVCPMPIVQIARAIKTLAEGQLLQVQADDPAFAADVEAWASQTGHELRELSGAPVFTALICKS